MTGARTSRPALAAAGTIFAMVLLAGCGSSADPAAVGTTPEAASSRAEGDTAWAIQGVGGRLIIEVMASDGARRRSPTTHVAGGDQTNPDWSPDGEQLTFVMTDAEGHDDLWVTNLDGSGARVAFDCKGTCDDIDDPTWSPDGASIAACAFTAVSETAHLGSLVSIDVATGSAIPLFTPTDPNDFCAGPRWSPDGQSLVLELVHRDGTGLTSAVTGVTLSIVDIAADPVSVTPLTDPSLFAATADWNRSGDLIVYSALPELGAKAPDLYTIKPDGSDAARRTYLADADGSASEPSFDLGGASVVFVAEGAPPLARLDLATGKIQAAFAPDTSGDHPRVRPPG